MFKFKNLVVVVLMSFLISSCKNSSSKEGNSAASEKIEEAAIRRPEKTEPKLRKQVYEYDSKVADISSTLRELKENMEKGTKITPIIEANINKLIADAKKMREPLLPLIDSLAEREFGNFNRDKDWIDQLETEWESLRQIK